MSPAREPFGEVADTPVWFPFQMDSSDGRILLVRKSEADYHSASFLDQRSLAPTAPRWVSGWSDLAAALPRNLRRDVQYIFHIGHVGSTLISRLLGELDSVLALREPLILRSFAELTKIKDAQEFLPGTSRQHALDILTALLSRTFRPTQRALVKATSFTSEIGDLLVPAGSRALFLYVKPRRYMETILAGENSRQELRFLFPSRVERLRLRCPDFAWPVAGASEAVMALASWICEMTSLQRSASALPEGSAMWLDFDSFLARPVDGLAATAAFFGVGAGADRIEQICAGPLMRRYSKALEYEYSPELREEVLAEARSEHGPAIDSALEMLEAAAERWPIVDGVLNRL